MARVHGKKGRIELATSYGGTYDAIDFIADWTFDAAVDTVEVTAMGDGNKTYVVGLPDATGTFSGFFDAESAGGQLFAIAQAGDPVGMRIYPVYEDSGSAHYEGDVFLDQSSGGGASGAVTLSSNWTAAGPISWVPEA